MGYTFDNFGGTIMFDKVAKTLTLSGGTLNSMKDIAVITDVTSNIMVYNFAKRIGTSGVTSFNPTTQVITLGYNTNTALFANTDEFIINTFGTIGVDASTNTQMETVQNPANSYVTTPDELVNDSNVTLAQGSPSTVAIANGGTGGTNGTGLMFTISGGSGTATFFGTIAGGILTAITAQSTNGYGYVTGTAIPITGNNLTGATVNITAVSTGINYFPDLYGIEKTRFKDISLDFQLLNCKAWIEITDETITTPVKRKKFTGGEITGGNNEAIIGSVMNVLDSWNFALNANVILREMPGYKFRIAMQHYRPTNTRYCTLSMKAF